MINYVEKGIELHEEIARLGYILEQVDGVWVADNEEAVQTIIDNFVPPSAILLNWDAFNLQMMSLPRFNQVYNTCLQNAPLVATALPTALDQVTTRGYTLFTLVWNQLCQIGGATKTDRNNWANIAVNNKLPNDFIAILRG
jgi:hypothetical protein